MYLSGISLLQKSQISFWPTSLVLAVQLTCSKLVRLASRTQDWNTSKYLHPGYHPGNSPNNSKQSVYHIYWQEQSWQHTSYGFGITMVPEDCFWGLRVESKGELLRMGRQKSVLTSHVGAGSCLKESSSCSVLTRLHTSHFTQNNNNNNNKCDHFMSTSSLNPSFSSRTYPLNTTLDNTNNTLMFWLCKFGYIC